MSFSKSLTSIGICSSDISELQLLVTRSKKNWSLLGIAFSSSLSHRSVYHHDKLSLPTKMWLRVVVGLIKFDHINPLHFQAIFFPFTHSDALYLDQLSPLEEFWSILNKFWANKTLSKPIIKRVNSVLRQSTNQHLPLLVSNLFELNFPLVVTRSLRHLGLFSKQFVYVNYTFDRFKKDCLLHSACF